MLTEQKAAGSGIRRRLAGTADRKLREKTPPQTIGVEFPLVHVTAVGAGREILACGQLEPRHCVIFGEKLVYFFLSRAAYKLKHDRIKSDQVSRFPFIFVLSHSDLQSPYHVYPFDTGAAAIGIYDQFADPWVFLDDYELAPDINDAMRHISWAFGSAEAYFDGAVTGAIAGDTPEHELSTRSFLSIAQIASSLHNAPDKRASAVEVSYRRNVPIRNSLVILPKQFLEDRNRKNDQLFGNLEKYNISWRVYDWRPNTSPEEYHSDIEEILRDYCKAKGMFDGRS